MKKFIVILVFAAALALLAGCEEEVFQLNELQKRDGVYVVPKTQKPYSGKFVTVYKSNAVKEAGTLKNGKRHGEITIYREDGSINYVQTFADDVLIFFTDQRDSKKYKIIKIGEQVWMAENLNYDIEGSKCFGEGGEVVTDYDDKGNPIAKKTLSNKEVLDNCVKYGRLYDWSTAMKACSSGWHLPSDSEWRTLVDFAGGEEAAGKKLKVKSGWNEDGNGTDEIGFSALPGGFGISDGSFGTVGYRGDWWSANEYNSSLAYLEGMYCNYDGTVWGYDYKSALLSVRCVQD